MALNLNPSVIENEYKIYISVSLHSMLLIYKQNPSNHNQIKHEHLQQAKGTVTKDWTKRLHIAPKRGVDNNSLQQHVAYHRTCYNMATFDTKMKNAIILSKWSVFDSIEYRRYLLNHHFQWSSTFQLHRYKQVIISRG